MRTCRHPVFEYAPRSRRRCIWTSVAYVFTLSVVGLPVAIWMYNKLPFVVSLYEY